MHRAVLARISDREYIQTLAIRTVGNFLILSSLFMIVRTLYQPVTEEIVFFLNDIQGVSYVVEDINTSGQNDETEDPGADEPVIEDQPSGFAQLFQQQRIEVMVPEDPNFSVVIPKIGANAPVVQNVNPGSEEEYLEALESGVAHARGTAFPGQGGHVFLFAHSTDYIWNIGSYNAVFYLLYKLEVGDEINVFYEGERYRYVAEEKVIIEASDVSYLTRQPDYELLTLQTCWPPGTTLKRLIVAARRVTE